MSKGARRSSVDTSLEDEVDSMLLEDGRGSVPSLGNDQDTTNTTITRSMLASLAGLTVTSTCTAQLVPYAATHSRSIVLILPVILFGSIASLSGLYLVRTGGTALRGTTGILELLSSQHSDNDRHRRRTIYLSGMLGALSLLLNLLEARRLDAKVWQALDILVLPTLLLSISLATQSQLQPSMSPPHAIALTCVAVSTLVGLVLIGVPAAQSGLLLAFMKAIVEAFRIRALKVALNDDLSVSEVAFASSLVSAGFSTPLVVISIISWGEDIGNLPFLAQITTLLLWGTASLLTFLALLATLQHLSSPLYAVLTILPRNTGLLLYATTGRGGIALRSHWLQMLCVLSGGIAGTVIADEQLAASLRGTLTLGQGSTRLGGWPGNSEAVAARSRTSVSKRLALLPFLAFSIYFIQTSSLPTASIASACNYLPVNVRSTLCHTLTSPISRTVDLVIAYYNENLDLTRDHIQAVRGRNFIKARKSRVLIYNKGPRPETELRTQLQLKHSDEVIKLPNVGREGQTYLQHILLHYNASISALASVFEDPLSPTRESVAQSRVLADHTIMLQPHMAWDWIANPRLDLIGPDTGFLHMGPMMVNKCGFDTRVDTEMALIRDIYDVFVGSICPPEGLLSAWSAQFVVSKRRILANAYSRYSAMNELISAPEGHWIHTLWGANDSKGPSNPAFGHHLERSWPAVMGCTDPKIAQACPDDVFDRLKCQCFDT